jgi:Zn-dependent protease
LINFFDPWPVVHFSGFAGARVLAVVMSAAKLTFLINVMLAVFNLIPVPPLDGSWVLEHLFPQSLGQLYARVRPYGFLLFVVLFLSGALRPLMTPAWWIVDLAFRLLHGCLGL